MDPEKGKTRKGENRQPWDPVKGWKQKKEVENVPETRTKTWHRWEGKQFDTEDEKGEQLQTDAGRVHSFKKGPRMKDLSLLSI